MHEFIVSAVAFIVLVGIMVVVHEFGHFALAKIFGVRVEAFSFGFGPRLFGFKYGDTDYKVCLLPLGGFVKMTGEAPEANLSVPGTPADDTTDDPGAFTSHPRWQRILIGLAGPVSNFLLAFVLMVVYFAWINEVPSVEVKTSTIEWVTAGSVAAQSGFQSGDVITGFDTATNPDWEQIFERVNMNLNQTVPVTVNRGGNTVQLSLRLPAAQKGEDFDVSDVGILPQYLPGPIAVKQVSPGTPADKAGLLAGDAIEAVDGHAFHTVQTLLAYMQAGKGTPITLTVLRKGATMNLVATPAKLDTGYKLGFMNQPPPYRNEPLSLDKAVVKSGEFCVDKSMMIFEVLHGIFTHKVAVSQLAGPVGIARMAGEAAEIKGWLPKFGLAGMISLNLGIINLMPFPILDGGMIFLLLIESVLGHDINALFKERVYQAAFVVLLAFFAFIIFSDVSKLPMFTHFKP
jgi:regulator of sigma E protease